MPPSGYPSAEVVSVVQLLRGFVRHLGDAADIVKAGRVKLWNYLWWPSNVLLIFSGEFLL